VCDGINGIGNGRIMLQTQRAETACARLHTRNYATKEDFHFIAYQASKRMADPINGGGAIEAEAEAEVQNFNMNAAHVQGNSVSKTTVATYRRCIKAFKAYTVEHYETSTNKPIADVYNAASGEFVLPMQVEFVEWYLGYLTTRRVPVKARRPAAGAPPPPDKALCVSSFTGICSAVVWYHHSKTIPVDGTLSVKMREFIKGYKRTIADMKLHNLYPMMEGKNFLTTDGYAALLDGALKLGASASQRLSQSVHFFPYLVLLWNTIARVHSVGLLALEHFGLANGCIFVKVPASKCDQDGENAFPKHMFSNSDDPKFCVVLALAMVVWTMSLRETTRLFPGNFPERKFCDSLHVVIDSLSDSLKAILTAIGAHSIKKGACTFLNGVLEGPNAHAVELRADHSIGDVRKCYIFRSVAQDQYCGRLLAMRDTDSRSFFATLPKLDDDCVLDWDSLLPGHDSVPANFKPLLPHLLATLAQHSSWLRATLPQGHPLLLSALFRSQEVERLKRHVVIGFSSSGGGIPRSIALAESQRQLPSLVSHHITENFSVTGVVPMTPAMFAQMLKEEMSRFGAVQQRHGEAAGVVPHSAMMHLWADGFYHELPSSFLMTSFDVQTAFLMYFQGNAGLRTMAYKRIKFDMLPTKNAAQKIMLSRLHCVVKHLISKSGKNVQELCALSSNTAQLTAAFDVALVGVQAQCPLCTKSWSYSYLYKHII